MLTTIAMLLVLVAAPTQPAVFDPARRRLRGNQVALDVEGGSITGRAIGQSFIVAGRVTYYPLARLGLGAAYGFSRGIGGLDTVRGRFVHLLHGRFELPLVAGLRMGKGDALRCLAEEVGALNADTTWSNGARRGVHGKLSRLRRMPAKLARLKSDTSSSSVRTSPILRN